MDFPILELMAGEFPSGLREIPQPPKSLNYRGLLPSTDLTLLSIVGSRKYTTYGKQVVDDLVSGLAGYPIGIVSGMALGIDSLAHETALINNLYTLAIPGGGLSDRRLYPATHKKLAFRILEAGGGLLSEFDPDFQATRYSFVQRNRLVAGISMATLLIEAGDKSGTLITARMVADYNRELLVVPGSIFSSNSKGVHQFLKLGATPVTSSKDILDVLHIETNLKDSSQLSLILSPVETLILSHLAEPTHKDDLIRKINLPTNEASQILMLMELQGHVKSEQNIYRTNL
ncbi:DNA-protecting protein DprA [Candidatus Nomurabacteria bacterium]|nr:DNA-processing protein DprA [Candidatus Kaiserbacteria bacterium]MCB9815277.1 DNA-protecting protein DprA [Candidatus Nomurabacteria bacterium]